MQDEAPAPSASEPPPDLQKRRAEDFEFLVICQFKENMAMYELLRDKELDKYKNLP